MKKSIYAPLVAIALVIGMAGCVPVDAVVNDPKPTATPEDTIEIDSTPLPEPEPEPAAPEAGTLENPGPAGSAITSEGWDGTTYDTVVTTVVNPANEQVSAANMFNEAAPAGQHYVLVGVKITNTTADTTKAVNPGFAASTLALVDAATGQSYPQADAVTPRPLWQVADLYSGQSGEGDVAFLVPDAVTSLLIADGGVFVALQ
jgi:hypothetical protein